MKQAEQLITYLFGVIALAVVLAKGDQVSGIIKSSSDFATKLTSTLTGRA